MSSSPVDPHTGPTSLDAYLDQLRDPHADEAGEPGRWVGPSSATAGEPSFVSRRPARGAPPAAPAGRPRTKKEQGEIDRRKLQAALEDPDLKEKPRGDFEDMLSRIHPQFGEYDCLTDRQRGYVQNVLDELGIDERAPAVRNASVPRGRAVELNFGQLPLAPPGRTATSCLAPPGKLSAPKFDAARCAVRLGGTEASCLHCGGLCPRPA